MKSSAGKRITLSPALSRSTGRGKALLGLLCVSAMTVFVSAQTTRPTLEILDRGMQELYQDVQGSLVRVVVPLQISPRLADSQHPLQKFNENIRVFVDRPLSTTQPL